ncbi:MAG: hypothetical protein ACK4PK_10225 [Alphaproteobacteria bacterium]
MADSTPSTTSFKLPDDVHVLAHLRDQLGDYLATLERNTDSISEWLEQQQNNIIVGHHRLVRAITFDKDEQKALKVLGELGETAGFILNLQDFAALARAQFGENAKLAKAISDAPRGFPADILEDLPAVRVPKEGETVEAIGLNTRVEIPAAAEDDQKKGFWSSIGGMFKGADPEEEARRKEEAIKRHWRNLRGELISLQSDRHYYVDSFMDWVAENLEPEDPQAITPVMMHQYQNPQYVIDLAQRDYAEVNQGRTQRLNAQALDYSALARKLDTQDIQGFIKLMPGLFPREETPESKRSKKLLLTDFGVDSFAELALTHVKKDADRIALLSAALSYEPKFEIAGLKSDAQIFERVLGEVLKPEPLDPAALELTLNKLRKGKGREIDSGFHLLQLYTLNNTPFSRIAARFAKEPARIGAANSKILAGLGAQDAGLAAKVADVAAAVENKDSSALLHSLRSVGVTDKGQAFMALWELTYPGRSLAGTITETGAPPKMIAQMTDALITAGMNDEWRAESNAIKGSAAKAIAFIAGQIIPSLAAGETFEINAARKMLATSFLNGGLDELRPQLTRSGGWLEQVVSSKSLSENDKLAWVAALIEPYAAGIVRANILHEAADNAATPAAAKILSGMEAAFTGENIRLDDDRLLTNLSRIANIWYNPEPKTLRFTISGVGQLLQENVSQHMADETLALIQRKAGFEPEYDGLVKPENIDRIVTSPQGTKIAWHRHTGDFNGTEAQAEALHRRADFLHEDDPQGSGTFSINQKSVLLLQPLEDGTHLLVDKYGAAHVLEGKIRLQPQEPLLDLGGVWFNPQAASILSLSGDGKTLEFRAESKEFDEFLEHAESGEYLYSITLPGKAAADKIAAVIQADNGFAAPLQAADTLALNLRALGYLSYQDGSDGEAGFACHKYGPTRKPGFVRTEDPEFAEALYQGLKKSPGVIAVENLIAHTSMIEDAYFNAEKNMFYMIVGQDILSTETDADTAYAALKKLGAEKGFETVGSNLIKNTAPNGVGMMEVPADVINLSRASLIAYNPAQDQTYVHTDQDKYHVSLDRIWTRTLFDRLEKEGRGEAMKQTQKMPWVRDLGKTLSMAQSFEISVKPALTDDAAPYLLAQAMGAKQETRKLPALNADFSAAAAPLSTGDTLRYPLPRQASTYKTKSQTVPKRNPL